MGDFLPRQLRTALGAPIRRIRNTLARFRQSHKSVAETHAYWEKPQDGNAPHHYVEREQRSRFLLDLMAEHVEKDAAILEIGCNVGRNLSFLQRDGYSNLTGIEISKNALEKLRENFPKLAESATLINKPVEEAIREFDENNFDVVFTMAVLEHIHEDSAWIFEEIVRVAGRYLIVIEDEQSYTWRHFPRNYRKVFEQHGARQIKEIDCGKTQESGMNAGFFARVFAVPTT